MPPVLLAVGAADSVLSASSSPFSSEVAVGVAVAVTGVSDPAVTVTGRKRSEPVRVSVAMPGKFARDPPNDCVQTARVDPANEHPTLPVLATISIYDHESFAWKREMHSLMAEVNVQTTL
jgi:hypothetical protein